MSETLVAAWWQILAAGGATFVAGVIAIWGIQTQRAIARRTLTFTHLGETDTDKDVIEARKIFIEEAKKPEGLTPWSEPGQEHTKQCEAIRLVLNEFELVSVGIQTGIIDYEFYKRYHRGTVIKYWYAAAPFVYSIRKQLSSKAIYHEFEELYRCFEADRPPARRFLFLKIK
jgi:hypothetical protein